MDVRPFFLLSQSYIAGLQSRIRTGIQHWESRWGTQIPNTLQIRSPQSLPSNDRQGVWQTWYGQAGLSVLVKSEDVERFCDQVLFADRRQTSLSDRHLESGLAPLVVSQAAADFVQQLLSAVREQPYAAQHHEQPTALPTEIFRAGADVLLISWADTQGKPLNLLVTGLPTPAIRSLGRPNQSWRQAIGKQHLQVKVELGQVELTVGQIETLRLGDVVKLDQSLDAPLLVRDDQDTPIFHCHPGTQHGHRAISLIKLKV
ncbi:FliM/FliN family flagellar motor switch protein [Chitinivorax sp. B]|uniref:FliM/FliN family flagellar motor switch protein n=1 Tax=Chitinivorax sp. B TaxID=2502235 RepID=UPI0010F933B4|nr:FliM/FliN family flagellar motor switch protein [Chitinivorax sp. B]